MNLLQRIWRRLTGEGTAKSVPREPGASSPKSPSGDATRSTLARVVKPREIERQPLSSTPPAAAVPDVHRARSNRTVVIVGFDFGTHSTKVLYRRRNEETSRLLSLAASAPGYPTFACPSLVRLDEGRLWFGAEALNHKSGTLYSSLKVRLLGAAAEPDSDFPDGPSPDVLVAAFLAWAFRVARAEISRQFNDAEILLNMAAPMDHLEDPRLKTRYLQIVQTAWEIGRNDAGIDVEQGTQLADVEKRLHQLLSREVVAESERKFDVLPETVAAMVSLSIDPRTAPGMYLIVDMGAGTTEISINHANEQGADHRILCYFDRTIVLGGDRFSRAAQLRQDIQHQAVQQLVADLMKACTNVWASGFEKDKLNHRARKRWQDLVILLAGGGTRHPAVAKGFFESPRLIDLLKQYRVKHEVVAHTPVNIDLGSITNAHGDISLLVVAHGLTSERRKWPIVFEPANIETLTPTVQVDRPEAYWYVGGK